MTTDNKPDALEPCPFCGGSAWAFMEKRLWVIRHKPVGNCPIANHNPYEMVGYETKAEAIAAWNTRPAPTGDVAELEAENAALREALERATALLACSGPVSNDALDALVAGVRDSMSLRQMAAKFDTTVGRIRGSIRRIDTLKKGGA